MKFKVGDKVKHKEYGFGKIVYINEQEEMEFMIYLYNNYPEIFYDILSFYMTAE